MSQAAAGGRNFFPAGRVTVPWLGTVRGDRLGLSGPKSSVDGLHGCGQSHQAAGGLVPGSAPPTGPPGPSLWRTCVHTRPCPAQPRGRAAAPRWRGPWPPGLPPGSSTVTAPWNQTSLCPSLTPHRSGSVPSASGVTAKLAVTSERTRGVRLIMSVTSAHGLCKTAARLGPSWAKGTLRGGPWSSVQSCRLVPELPLGSPHTARRPRLLAAARLHGALLPRPRAVFSSVLGDFLLASPGPPDREGRRALCLCAPCGSLHLLPGAPQHFGYLAVCCGLRAPLPPQTAPAPARRLLLLVRAAPGARSRLLPPERPRPSVCVCAC